jgi:hypothetical protein
VDFVCEEEDTLDGVLGERLAGGGVDEIHLGGALLKSLVVMMMRWRGREAIACRRKEEVCKSRSGREATGFLVMRTCYGDKGSKGRVKGHRSIRSRAGDGLFGTTKEGW